MVPIFAVLFGVLLLNEPVGVGTFVELGTILSSVALVTGARLGKGKRRRGKHEEDEM
jgi:drug/metabolite transporter (DMT)-like permease